MSMALLNLLGIIAPGSIFVSMGGKCDIPFETLEKIALSVSLLRPVLI